MVGFEIIVKIHPEKRHEFLQTFQFMAQKIQSDKCTERCLFEKLDVPNSFLWRENWQTEESLNNYRETSQYRSVLGAIDVLGSLEKIRTFIMLKGGEK